MGRMIPCGWCEASIPESDALDVENLDAETPEASVATVCRACAVGHLGEDVDRTLTPEEERDALQDAIRAAERAAGWYV